MNLLICMTLSFLITVASAGDVIEKNFISEGYHYHAEEMSNLKYPFITVEDSTLLLATHSSIYWDTNKRTWPAHKLIVDFFHKNNYPLKYMAVIEERSLSNKKELKLSAGYYPPGIKFDDLYPFQGDSHRIVFKGDNVVITGGNFTICACGTARSIIALSNPTSRNNLNLYFAMDAIYEGQKGIFRLLSEISNELDDTQFMQYLEDEYFNEDSLPCKEPTIFVFDRRFNYKIYRKNKLIGRFGEGNTSVNLFFENTKNIILKLRDKK